MPDDRSRKRREISGDYVTATGNTREKRGAKLAREVSRSPTLRRAGQNSRRTKWPVEGRCAQAARSLAEVFARAYLLTLVDSAPSRSDFSLTCSPDIFQDRMMRRVASRSGPCAPLREIAPMHYNNASMS